MMQQKQEKISKTKQCLLVLAERLQEQGDEWGHFLIGTMHPLYRRTFMGGGTAAVRRRLAREAEREYRQHLALLKRQQWIAMRRIGSDIQIALTPKGRTLALKEQMRSAARCAENECVVVVFDVPERERFVRRQFRHLLKSCRFTQLQRSVWVSQHNVLAHLHEFIRTTKADKWIRAFRAHDVAQDKDATK